MSGPREFHPEMLASVDEPVRRYLNGCLASGTGLHDRWVVGMKGSIKVGLKLPFTARQDLDGKTFTWKASVPSERIRLLEVTDWFNGSEGGMIGRIGRWQAFADQSGDSSRSAATRGVMEGTMVPAMLLPRPEIEWRATSETEIHFRRSDVPLAEEVTVRLDSRGRAFEIEALRWQKSKDKPGQLVPFICRFEGEQKFNGITVPRDMTAGWGGDGFEPFFEARITSIRGLSVP